jgi:hypothetical protein
LKAVGSSSAGDNAEAGFREGEDGGGGEDAEVKREG